MGGIAQLKFSSVSSAAPYDSDADAFFTRAGITDTTEKNAWTTFVISAKGGDAYWSNLIAIWPFLGGTSSTTAKNATNVDDYDITWSGALTYNSMGVTGNGSHNGATGFYGNYAWTNSSISHGGYYRTAITSGKAGIADVNTEVYTFNSSGNFYSVLTPLNAISVSLTFSRLIIVNVNTANVQRIYRDGVDVANNTATITTPQYQLKLFGVSSLYSSHSLGMYYISSGLSTAQIAQFNTNVNTLMTSLSRNV